MTPRLSRPIARFSPPIPFARMRAIYAPALLLALLPMAVPAMPRLFRTGDLGRRAVRRLPAAAGRRCRHGAGKPQNDHCA